MQHYVSRAVMLHNAAGSYCTILQNLCTNVGLRETMLIHTAGTFQFVGVMLFYAAETLVICGSCGRRKQLVLTYAIQQQMMKNYFVISAVGDK